MVSKLSSQVRGTGIRMNDTAWGRLKPGAPHFLEDNKVHAQ